jgi:hypothetical protein
VPKYWYSSYRTFKECHTAKYKANANNGGIVKKAKCSKKNTPTSLKNLFLELNILNSINAIKIIVPMELIKKK